MNKVIELNEMELDGIVGGNIFEDAWDWISGDAWDFVKDTGSKLWDNFKEKFWEKGIKETFWTGPKKVVEAFGDIIEIIWKELSK